MSDVMISVTNTVKSSKGQIQARDIENSSPS